ncbi:MAG: polysaccharide deacetylase family protein [Gelidibacter sp.]|nr:polysaccharide deacetylase family protein [Gelidibacter sp.]
MRFVPVKTPLVVKKMFPNYVWNMATDEKIIYLTFDDGPTPEITNWTLAVLNEYNAKATFFCIGNNVKKHPEVFQNILKEGHTIGNHTHTHLKGWKTKTKAYIENVALAQSVIDVQYQGPESINQNLFRPPYGQLKTKQGKKLIKQGYKIIMWDVISFDWERSVSKEKCLKNVLSTTKKGSIVVFHDSVKASKNMQFALPKVLQHFSEKGYLFKALT